ncbi:hypothetical protein NLX86_18800 [Streptomyces sp. A3M-1-3]|uniref:hypothetical protein n=1 Tax=Streptomyces sp. A3M-1-3 TaxID=2962044 RepID=UPI0020B889FF|nr:hypothetical protein [Streptomyces sp. A3M-1-3]MCP3820067.1 hypothetical protein [Streptomyces sp. A3M-1-3]
MAFDLGAVVPLGTTVKDSAGVLANAGSMALTITLPDATTVAVSPVTPTSTGVYAYDYATVQAGRHTVRWVATGINAGAYTDSFDVSPAATSALLSLADAKKHLNIPASSTSDDDDEIRGWLEATTRVVEHFVGPIARRTVVETHRVGWVRALVLRQTPVIALTAVAPVLTGGTTYAVADLDLDGETGVIVRKDGGALRGPLRVTYTAGRLVVAANISHAARIILQHLWRTQRGSARGPALAGGDDYAVTEPIPGLGYAVPNRALELLQPDRLPPGVA